MNNGCYQDNCTKPLVIKIKVLIDINQKCEKRKEVVKFNLHINVFFRYIFGRHGYYKFIRVKYVIHGIWSIFNHCNKTKLIAQHINSSVRISCEIRINEEH